MSKHNIVSEISFPSDVSLHHLFSRQAERYPDKTALIFRGESMTFRQLDQRSDEVAARLLQLGVQPEDFVALYLERSLELIVGIFGILKAGGAYVPIDVDYPRDRMAFMLDDAQARIVLTQHHLKDKLPATGAEILCLDQPLSTCAPPLARPLPATPADRLAYMIYTSGSTGRPKGVMITHENVCNQLEGQQAIAPEPIGAMMLTTSISFDVSVLTIFWSLLQGATLVIPRQGEEKDMTRLADTIYKNKVTHVLTLPSLYTLLLEQAPPEKLQSIRLVNVSGEVCPVSLAQKHEQLIPNGQLYNLYGPTEATVNCTYFKFPKGFDAKKAPIGKPIKNYQIFILNENREEVPPGEVGEIYIGGTKPVVGRGYWNRPQLTAARFIDPSTLKTPIQNSKTLYRTGDLARWMPDGNIEFLGRSDFQVKYRGFRIELGEIETALSNHPAVKETVVMLRNPHEVGRQQLVAYLTFNQNREVSVSELRDYLSATLPEYMLPSRFVFLKKMPLTTNGKFDRNALPAPAKERPRLASAFEAPLSALEKDIAARWETLLDVAPIGRHDKFFELGGTSIQAARFIGEMMEKLNTSIFITTIFDHPTVAAYARFLQETYPENLTDNAIIVSHGEGECESPLPFLTPQQIAAFPQYIPIHLSKTKGAVNGSNAPKHQQLKNTAPIFILAPPRSGTTLLRMMLAGHPGLFACNELQLLHFHTLAQRQEAYTGKFALWAEGLLRALMELRGLNADSAKSLLHQLAANGTTTRQMFDLLHQWSGQRTIVDKSPSYLLDPLALEKAITDFPNARFIHLVRHPYSMVTSFQKYHLDQVLYLRDHPYTPRQLGELVWLHSHQNAIDFFEKIPPRQQTRLLYEDLVRNPETAMQQLCHDLRIPFHPNLLNPYRDLDKKMTDGLYHHSRSMGDTHFEKKKKIDPKKADDWKGVLTDNFLSPTTCQLAARLGYPAIGPNQSEKRPAPNLPSPNDQPNPAHGPKMKKCPIATPATPAEIPIAIIGMACRFPGADNVEEFWENLIRAKDVAREVTDADLAEEGCGANGNYVRKTYAPADPYCFDAAFFGFLKREAELTDPQHRLFLQTAYEALENAGYDPFSYKGKIGVFGGVARNTYFTKNILTNPALLEEAGGYREMIATESTFSISRVAYKLNLRGPAVNVQTACSTGGVAVHLACQSILQGDSDMVIVGGGRVQAPVNGGYQYVDGGPLSPDGTLRAFDADANGMVQGNGMGMLVLKRLDRAEADGDHIWALIRSSAINNDGSDKTGLTAPSSKGQADCIAQAIEKAGLTAAQISYFETHGTGTFIGDPIEIQGLTQAVSKTCNDAKIPIGSVKTNIGHLDAGACIAGIIKTALALKYEMLPPSMHFTRPNPQLNLDQSPFYVLDKIQPWLSTGQPRRAGVSSFGLGGTNAHIILEEYSKPSNEDGAQQQPDPPNPQLLLVSAKTEAALDRATKRLIDFLKKHPQTNLANAAQTLATGRPHFTKRNALVAQGDSPPKVVAKGQQATAGHTVVFMFPGGGAQYAGMAAGLYASNAFFKHQVDACLDILKNKNGMDIRPVLFAAKGDQSEVIRQPSFALASLFTIEYALARLWQHWGVLPSQMIGHSMGEYTAACLAGVMTPEEALALVTVRGRLFETLEGDGCMLGIAATEQQLRPLLDADHTISVVNKKDSLVVSSTKDGIARLRQRLEEKGIDSQTIHIAVPAHSPLIEPILDDFKKHLLTVNLREPSIPFISNVTGTWITPQQATNPDYWIQHIRQTVRFADGLDTLLSPTTDPKKRIFLEVGPGQTLCSFARAVPTLRDERPLILASVRHPKEVTNDVAFIYKTAGKLWATGVDIHWNHFFENPRFRRIPLPTYPFEKEKFFIKPRQAMKTQSTTTSLPTPAPVPDPLPNAALGASPSGSSGNVQPGQTPPANAQNDTPSNSPARVPRLVSEIQHKLHELSGMDLADLDPQATFLELGFDSLFLSQAVIQFNYHFKLKLSFRQLFEEAPTIEALAELADREMPADLFQPAPQPPATGEPPVATPTPEASVAVSQLESLIQQQLDLMQQQLALLRNGWLPGQIPVRVGDNGTTAKKEGEEKAEIARSQKGVTPKMSNYKKINTDGHLNEKQREALAAFIQRYNKMTPRSKELAQRHRQYYADPRSTTGFSRLWKEICYQIAHKKSKGSKIWDVDGNEYIDYVMSYGVALFGHNPAFVEKAVLAAVRRGNSIDLLPAEATQIAKMICEMTGYDRVTLANTGTEAVLGAVRAARTATGRERIAVFDTDYHGMIDQFMVRGIHLKGKNKTLPASPGIPQYIVEGTLTLDYDDPQVLQKLENEIAGLAAVVVEPVQAQNPHWQHGELLKKIRQLTEKHGVALIFDEIINGFRMHQRGAQGWYGVEADISAYGKSISGGLPLSAIAGKAKYMNAFDGGVWSYGDDSSPDGVIAYFAGTFIKNPISVAAAHAAISEIKRLGPALQKQLNDKTIRFAERIRQIFLRTKAPFFIQSASSFFMIKYADANPLSKLFHYFLRARGVNVRERPCFISTSHTEADFEKTYQAFEGAIADMFDAGLLRHYHGEDLNVIVRPPQDTSQPSPVSQEVVPHAPLRVPLTEGQQEIFLSDRIAPQASKAYNIATEIRLEGGALDVERMKAALQALVNRHEALRTVIHADGKGQTILPRLKVNIPVVDLRADAEADKALAALHNEEADHLFDLENGPLVRFKIILLKEKTSLVFIHVHHIICDGWSLGILTRELGEVYANGPGAANLKNPKQLSVYAQEQSALRQSSLFAENEKYWLGQFADGVPVLHLPADYSRPPVKTYGGAVEKISFDAAFTKQLRAVAARQGTTFYVFMLAAYQAYLSRITGQDDFVVGIAAAGHNLPGNQHLVAHAIGLLPVRVQMDDGVSFQKYVKYVRGRVLDAFDHQQFTYGSLVKKLKIERSANRNTLVSVAFNLDSPLDHLFFGDLTATTRAIPRHYETFDTFINLKPVGDKVDFEWNFNTDIFNKETIRLRLHEFKQFLQAIMAEADKPIARLRLLPDFESQQIAAFGQGDKMDFPLHLCLHQLFEQQAAKTPAKVAVQMTNGARLTYRELDERATDLAHRLVQEGVQPDTFVGLFLDRSPDILIGLYGILKAGAAYVPIDPRNPQERIRFLLNDAGCRVVVTEKALLNQLSFFDGKTLLATAGRNGRPRQLPAGRADRPAYVIYTSGSTGTPKGVVVRHENAVNTLFAINRLLKISGDDKVYSVSSFAFDMSIPDYFLTLITGATLLLADEKTKKDGFALRTSLEHFQPTIMQATPTTWQILLLSGWQGHARLTAIAGGEGFPKELAAQLADRCKKVFNGYGPTETTIYATWQEVTPEHLNRCPGEYVAIGSPIANVQLHILDKNQQPVPIGVPGELYIGGNGLSSGYLNRPDLTAQRFLPKDQNSLTPNSNLLYRTGDLVRYLPTGEIEFLGRLDDQVKIRGYRIELGEIEAVMNQSPLVEQAVVAVCEDATGSPRLAGYVVWQEGADREGLRAFLKEKLPGYMVPAIYVDMDALPTNTSLKVDRKALPRPDLSQLSTAEKEAPVTKGEKLLTNIWKELLGVEELSVQDDFFELGGHSLAAVQLMARIRESTGIKLPLTTLFQHSTIKKLAGQLNGYNNSQPNGQTTNGKAGPPFSSLVCIREGGSRPPLYLVHGGGLHVLFYQNLVKHLPEDQPIYALQAKGLNEGEEPLDTIEEMAAHYISEIKKQNPHGPYCLAGYSLGGLIAWEMAAQLKADNREVPLLALFDAVAKYEWAGSGNTGNLKKKMKKLGFNVGLLLKDPARAIEYKSAVLKMQFQHLKGQLRMAWHNNKTNEIEEGTIPFGKAVYQKSMQAYDKYVLKPLHIHVDLFKAKEQMFYLHDPEHYGWDQFALLGLTVHEIEGNHLTLFNDPHGRQVAEALKRRLMEIGVGLPAGGK